MAFEKSLRNQGVNKTFRGKLETEKLYGGNRVQRKPETLLRA